MTLGAQDAPDYVSDLIREAGNHIERAHGLLHAADQILTKLAAGSRTDL